VSATRQRREVQVGAIGSSRELRNTAKAGVPMGNGNRPATRHEQVRGVTE
jgi:hypothetical protein